MMQSPGPISRVLTSRSRLLAALLLAAAGAAGAGLLPDSPRVTARADEVTISGGNLREGWDSAETTGSLSPATLLRGSFGELFSTAVNGQVYAQPLVVGHTVIVATENDWVYGLDARTGAIEWSTSLGAAWVSASNGGCIDLKPDVGVTGTPVYDPAVGPSTPDGAVYLVADVVPQGSLLVRQPVYYLEALDPVTGAEIPGWPVPIRGLASNDPTVSFHAFNQFQRPGLLLLGGSVYAAFGGICDYSPYDGFVAGVNLATKATTLWTDESGLTSSTAGIWQSGAGLVSDAPGRIFFTSGNGLSPAPGPGTSPPGQLGDSVVRLGVQSNGTLAAQDFFSPANAPYLDTIDGDLGSGGLAGLPFGTATLTDLLVQIGKDGRVFVLNANGLGGREQGPGGGDGVVSVAGAYPGGQWGHPATFADTPTLNSSDMAGASDYVYYVGRFAPLRYLRASLAADGQTPILSDVAQSDQTFGFTSGSPVVTSNGTDPSSAVIWVVNSSDATGATGSLEAYPALPTPPQGGTCSAATMCSVAPLWQYPLTGAGKFTTPATDSGRVYIGTRGTVSNGTSCPSVPSGTSCGQVMGFGSPTSAPLTGSPASFADVPVGTTSTAAQVTVSVPGQGSAVSVTAAPAAIGPGFAVAGPFEYTPSGGSPVPVTNWPLLMSPGDSLTAQGVTFSPAVPGAAAGAVQFATDSPNFPAVSVPLTGNGTQQALYATPSAVSFGSAVPVGSTVPVQVNVTNDGTDPQALTAAQSSSPLFAVTGVPPSSQVIQPGTSVSVTIGYSPAAAPSGAPDTGTVTLTATDQSTMAQTPTAIPVTGTSVADSPQTLTASPATLSFGSVHLGQQTQRFITVTNNGNLTATISGYGAPAIPFGNPVAVTRGLAVSPGLSMTIPVTCTPSSVGSVAASYHLTWADLLGTHTLVVPVTAAGVAPSAGIAVPPPGGGWTFNGSATMRGRTLNLTSLTGGKAGSAVYSQPVASNGLAAKFTVQIGAGTGGDGMTFSLLDATKTAQPALGGGGGLLGFGGLPGVAVTLDTSKDGSNYPSANFAGIATGAKNGQLTFAATATNIPVLRTGRHVVGVSASGGKLTVTVDGKQYLSSAVPLPPLTRIAFTGSTGALTDNHQITSATITAGGVAIPQPGGGWSYNGSAAAPGSDTALTPALPSRAGAVIYPVAVTANGLRATFNVQLAGGSGGDGMAVALLDPATVAASAVGGTGPLLGFGGLSGVAVLLSTDHSAPDSPGTDFVGLTTHESGGMLPLQDFAQGLPALRGGTRTVTITVIKNASLGYVLTVWLDGVRMLQDAVPAMTATVLLGFTAGTGSTTDLQIVRDAAIAASG